MNTDFALRTCTPSDAAALSILGKATFWETFAGLHTGPDILAHCQNNHTEAQYRAWLADPRAHLWVAQTDPGRAAVGYLLMAPADLPDVDTQPNDWEIKRVYLLHRFQGLGLGKRLMDVARAQAVHLGANRLLLGVYAQNAPAIAFYKHLGYQPIGTRNFQVGTTVCDDLILGLTLAPQRAILTP